MDAVTSLSNAQQSAIQSQVNVAVAKKSLDAMKASGDAVNALLQDAAQLSKAIGKGAGFDAAG